MDKLIELLNENSQFTVSELSAMLNRSEEDIKHQIEEYEKQGIIKGYKALINWDKLADSCVSAIIELKVVPKKETGFDEIAKSVMHFDEVESVYLMAGGYDLLVMVKGKNIQEISMFVSRRLSTLDSVVSTATHFVLSRYKDGGVTLFNDEEADKRSMIL